MKKFHFVAFAGAFVLCLAFTAQAAVVPPTINGVKGKTKNSLSLLVKDASLAKKKAYIQVYVDEINEGEIYTFKYFERLDKSGKDNVKVNGLDQGTSYRFKVRTRLHTEDSWSDWSEYYYTTTKGNLIW